MPYTEDLIGWKGTDTSRQAAEDMSPDRAAILRQKTLDTIRRSGPISAGDIAKAIDEYLYSVAPRITELRKDGLVRDSGLRHKSDRGKPVIAWEIGMEPHCAFCGLYDKNRCRSAEAAEDCPHAPVEGKSPIVRSGPLQGLRRQHYGAIYADVPWTFLTRSDKGRGRSPDQHYDVMTLEEIKALPVAELAAPDCALFFWVIDTHLAMALDVISAWGFEFKTRAFCWAKLNAQFSTYSVEDQRADGDRAWKMGNGFWTRANPEDCWLATRGAPKRQSAAVRRLVVSPVREHSRKPDEVKERIEQLVPGPYVELFSRSNRNGWDAMGNETGKFDPTPDLDDEALALL
jgi:N6-adenosine-specific RNA methylase IME4